MANDNKTLPEGYILNSPLRSYKILGVIGRGGFGITYKAEVVDSVADSADAGPGTLVAIKELYIAEFSDRSADFTVEFAAKGSKAVANSEKDFIREATMLNRLGTSHPNIVKVHEVFNANNTAYYSMDFLEGTTLQEYIAAKGPQPIRWALRLLSPLFDAVECLHNNRMTHLDIKPGNIIMVEKDGAMHPVLIDFGLSKHYDDEGNSTSLVQNVACSKGYAPLEQYAGLSTFTPQADVYALAATLYFCLTGAAPEIASELNPKSLKASLPHELPESAAMAIMQAMRKGKEHRTQSVAKFREDLKKVMPVNKPRPRQVIVEPVTVSTPADDNNSNPIEPTPPSVKAKGPAAESSTRGKKKQKGGSKAKLVITLALIFALAIGIFGYIGMMSPTRRISRAIKNSDVAVLREFSEKDSIRAMIPLAKLEYMAGNLRASASTLHRLDELGVDLPSLQNLRNLLGSKAYETFHDYVKANIPDSYTGIDETVLEEGLVLRAEADTICMLAGIDGNRVNQVFDTQLNKAFRAWVYRGDIEYDKGERVKNYEHALKLIDDPSLRRRLERLK